MQKLPSFLVLCHLKQCDARNVTCVKSDWFWVTEGHWNHSVCSYVVFKFEYSYQQSFKVSQCQKLPFSLVFGHLKAVTHIALRASQLIVCASQQKKIFVKNLKKLLLMDSFINDIHILIETGLNISKKWQIM